MVPFKEPPLEPLKRDLHPLELCVNPSPNVSSLKLTRLALRRMNYNQLPSFIFQPLWRDLWVLFSTLATLPIQDVPQGLHLTLMRQRRRQLQQLLQPWPLALTGRPPQTGVPSPGGTTKAISFTFLSPLFWQRNSLIRILPGQERSSHFKKELLTIEKDY